MNKLLKLDETASNEDVIKKVNEIIDFLNKLENHVDFGSSYVTPGPSPYDLNAWPRKNP